MSLRPEIEHLLVVLGVPLVYRHSGTNAVVAICVRSHAWCSFRFCVRRYVCHVFKYRYSWAERIISGMSTSRAQDCSWRRHRESARRRFGSVRALPSASAASLNRFRFVVCLSIATAA